MTFEKKQKVVTLCRKIFVHIRYIFPALCVIFTAVICACPLFRFDDGTTKKEYQSYFELAQSAKRRSDKTLLQEGTVEEQVNTALAKDMKAGAYAFWIFISVAAILSLLLLIFHTVNSFSDPLSPSTNKRKAQIKAFFPKSWIMPVIPFLASVPLILPHFTVNRFAEYYRIQGMSSTQTPVYYDYSVLFRGADPLVLSLIFASVYIVIFVLSKKSERLMQMSIYDYYQ